MTTSSTFGVLNVCVTYLVSTGSHDPLPEVARLDRVEEGRAVDFAREDAHARDERCEAADDDERVPKRIAARLQIEAQDSLRRRHAELEHRGDAQHRALLGRGT